MAGPKRFLVIVRAGEGSLHPQWTRTPATRNWDLAVSYFGDDPDRFRDAGEIRIDDKGQKWAGLHALLTREKFWQDYDYVWLPDDDLATSEDVIADLFATMSELELALAQPALSWMSYFSHPITIRHPAFRMRMTNFVEIMAPCFERRFLETCLPTFTENRSGWGLDWVWPHLLPDDARRCGVIDSVAVTHTRPVGGPSHQYLRAEGVAPLDEAFALMRRYAIPTDSIPRVWSAVDADGHWLDGSRSEDAATIRDLIARDWAAFKAFRRRRPTSMLVEVASQRQIVYRGQPVTWWQ